MLFLKNKYTKWYYNIIYGAKLRSQNYLFNHYTEKHHILPRSLGGDNSAENLVILTGREHFICHILLTKMVCGQDKHKMIHAAIGMKRTRKYQKRYINSRLYEAVRRDFAKIVGERSRGKTASSDTRAKMSIAGKGRSKTDEHRLKISLALKGKTKSPEHCKKLSIANQGKIRGPMSELTREKHRNRRHSAETRQKISESNRRRRYSKETKQKISDKIKQLHAIGHYKS